MTTRKVGPTAPSLVSIQADAGSTLLFELLRSAPITTAASGGQWDRLVLTDDVFAPLGPALVDVILHSEGEVYHADFRYRVRLEQQRADGTWGDPPGGAVYLLGSVATPITTPAPQVTTPFNDRSKLGVGIRLVLECQNNSSATLISAVLTIRAAVRLCGGA